MSYHHGYLKETLLQTGADELRAHGAENLSLRDIAKKAGVSHNAPYRHFRDKNEFVEKILERALRELSDQIQSAPLLYPASVFMQARFIGRLWAQMALRHPRQARLLFAGPSETGENSSRILAASHQLVREQVASVLNAARGSDLRPEIEPHRVALVMIAAFRGLALLSTSGAEGDVIESEDDLYNLCDMAAENILLPYAL